MKSIQLLVAALVVLAAPFMTVGVVAADSCEVGYTGPNSENLCVKTETYVCEVENNNTITVDNGNTQIAVSGDGEGEGNITGGETLTGSATNDNGTVFDIVVTNDTETETSTCVLTTSVPATPESPAEPSGGSGSSEEVVPVQAAKPQVLAYTSGDMTTAILIGLGALAAVAAGTAFVLSRSTQR